MRKLYSSTKYSIKVKKVQNDLSVESNNFHLHGKPTCDMTEIENVKIIPVQ